MVEVDRIGVRGPGVVRAAVHVDQERAARGRVRGAGDHGVHDRAVREGELAFGDRVEGDPGQRPGHVVGEPRGPRSGRRQARPPDVQASRSSSTISAKREASETTTAARPALVTTEHPLTPVPAGSGEALIPAASTRYSRVAPRSRAQNTMASPWNCGGAPG